MQTYREICQKSLFLRAFQNWLEGLKDIKGRAIIRKKINLLRLGYFSDSRSLGNNLTEVTMKKKTKKYEDSLIKSLKNPVEAAAYLTVHIEGNSQYAEETFLLALKDVAKAYGIKKVAEKAKVGRESLYKTLSGSVNPKLTTLRNILDSIGLKMTIEPKDNQTA